MYDTFLSYIKYTVSINYWFEIKFYLYQAINYCEISMFNNPIIVYIFQHDIIKSMEKNNTPVS